MWTHRHPYRNFELTPEYIQERGQLTLSRALNVRRVIGFVGSGATAAYGRPSWRTLVDKAVRIARQGGTKRVVDPVGEALEAAIEQFGTPQNAKPDDLVVMLALAENLARKRNRTAEFRQAIAAELVKSREDARMETDEALKWPEDGPHALKTRAEPIQTMLRDLKVCRFLTLNYDVEIERELEKHFRTSGDREFSRRQSLYSEFEELASGQNAATIKDIDEAIPEAKKETEETVLRAIILSLKQNDKNLHIARILEDGLKRIRRGSKFEDALSHEDGLGKSVLSVTLGPDNVGDLVNFSLYSREYGAQVFHLHGRYDQPEHMVLTEKDYQNTYLRSGEKKETFDEALSAVFEGNDVLFVGVGMQEADMMRPLRQFVSQDRSPDFSKRHVYTLMERQCGIDRGTAFGSVERFFDSHFGSTSGAGRADRQTDTAQSLKLSTQFGIYTLFYGDERVSGFDYPVLRFLRLACQTLNLVVGNINQYEVFRPVLEAFATKIGDLKKIELNAHETPSISSKLLEDAELQQIQLAFRSVSPDWSSDKCRKAKKFTGTLESEIRARALDRALYDLGEKRKRWWSDWRLTPAARNARFGKAYSEEDTDAKFPNMARHRPDYDSWIVRDPNSSETPERPPLEDDVDKIAALRRLRSLARKVADRTQEADEKTYPSRMPGASRFGRRVVRVSMPRGAGKGSLLHLLREDICRNDLTRNRFVLDTLFSQSEKTGRPGVVFRYHGSFMLHLSFSMEFASVIDALRIFFEDALAGLVEDRAPQAIEELVKLLAEWRSNQIPEQDEPDEIGLLRAVLDTSLSPDGESYGGRIGAFRETRDTQEPFRRGHRLDQLRSAIDAFQMLAARVDPHLRVCVIMSGLDKLCNVNGEAYNPMYRAFFRLLTGEGSKREHESNPLVPMDLVLISGSPGLPSRYLSEQKSKDEVLTDIESKGLSYSPGSEWKPYHGGALMLRAWKELPAIGIADRYWLRKSKCKSAFVNALIENGQEREGKWNALHYNATIRNILAKNVALSSWCAGAFETYCQGKADPEEDLSERSCEFLKQLDDAADRAGIAGVIGFVFETHKRSWYEQDAETASPIRSSAKADLAFAIMSHLSLFPMPVEPRVLYGCNEIYSVLHRIDTGKGNAADTDGDAFSAPGEEGAEDGSGRPVVSEQQEHEGRRGKARSRCLAILNEMLEELFKAHLIIKVKPKPAYFKSGTTEDWQKIWEKVHARYTVQHQLRDYIGHQMDLFVPDQGERNFFQLSLYCDQPRDLPTPTEAHYRMIRALMERQIQQCRNTLWCLYQWEPGRKPGQTEHQKPLAPLAASGMLRRLQPDDADEKSRELDPTLASFHALPQRIRALYGLMRGGFSIGAISRLPGLNDEPNPDEPFVRFRGWLRGITNAAIAMNLLEDKLDLITAKAMREEMAGASNGTSVEHSVVLKKLGQGAEDDTLTCKKFFPHRIAQPLYRDEIGWLLNERGLIAFVQGQLFDAIPLFERAAQVMQHRKDNENGDPALNAAVRRVQLNHSIAMIERGNMFKAREMIEGLLLPSVGSEHPGSQVSWIGEGYLGLIRHLAGDRAIAKEKYLRLIRKANEQEMPRLVSIFNRHLADVHNSQFEFELARAAADDAIGAALQSEQRDILWYCRLTRLRISLAEETLSSEENGRTLEGALEYARSMGLNKLEITALIAQGQVMLKQGERVLAGRIAARAAALANRCGLRLLKIAALTVYGEALIMRQQYHLALKILSEAHRESERRGYQNRSGQITILLEKIPSHIVAE
ncbi:SIR2 family protein [Roseibium marinum]|uniref:SIR2-like protein n=1 Tax=Roseibium marinum TaxID=281252 RepID=A0A2S3V4N4_9HYPH|nr:SIR2 family protein [Roseibium marinum]POF34743.1 SIR2-like protein [Roseibium marinum]